MKREGKGEEGDEEGVGGRWRKGGKRVRRRVDG
jgi:hypothetical protein